MIGKRRVILDMHLRRGIRVQVGSHRNRCSLIHFERQVQHLMLPREIAYCQRIRQINTMGYSQEIRWEAKIRRDMLNRLSMNTES